MLGSLPRLPARKSTSARSDATQETLREKLTRMGFKEDPWPPGECSMILFENCVIHLIEDDATPPCWSSDNKSRGEIGPARRLVGRYSLNELENCSVVKVPVGVTPVSKKQVPPNDRPIACTLCVASTKASMTAGLLLPPWPFQSDHSAGSAMLAMIILVSFGRTSCGLVGWDHQNWV